MYQSESNNTHIDGTQSFVCGAFPHHLNEVSPGRAVLFLTWRTPLRYRLGKAKGRQKSHFLPFPNLYRQAYYNHNRELRNMYYHIPQPPVPKQRQICQYIISNTAEILLGNNEELRQKPDRIILRCGQGWQFVASRLSSGFVWPKHICQSQRIF